MFFNSSSYDSDIYISSLIKAQLILCVSVKNKAITNISIKFNLIFHHIPHYIYIICFKNG